MSINTLHKGDDDDNNNNNELQTARRRKTEEQRETRKIKDSIAEKKKEKWQGKRMHGQLPPSEQKYSAT